MVCPPHVRVLLDSRLSTRCLSGLPRLGFLLCELSACRSSHCAGRRVVDLWVAACWVAVSGRLVLVAWMDFWTSSVGGGGSCLWIPGPGLSPLHSSPLRTPTRRLSRLLLLGFPPLWTLCLLRVAGLHTAQGHQVVGIWVAACWVSGSRPAGSWSSGQCGVF